MATDTRTTKLIINDLTKEQYESIVNPSDTELYLVPDDGSAGGATWGSIGGTLSDQTDLQGALEAKQDVLTPGDGITIENNTISGTLITIGEL